jgi:hypothetical protein
MFKTQRRNSGEQRITDRGGAMKEPKREARRKKLVELVKADGTKPTPEELGVCRKTLYNDFTALDSQGQLAITEQDRRQMVNAQYEVLLRMEKAAIEGTLDPDVINTWNRVRESIAKLLGLNAPAKTVTAHVEVNPEHSQEFLDYRAAVAHLNDEQKAEVLRYAKSLPNVWVAPPMPIVKGELCD